MNENQSEEIEHRILILAITFWPQKQILSVTKPDSYFWYKSLALQDYKKKAPDDEL